MEVRIHMVKSYRYLEWPFGLQNFVNTLKSKSSHQLTPCLKCIFEGFGAPHFLPGNKNEYGETVVSRQEGGHSYQVLEDGPGTRYSLRNRVHLSQQPKKQEFAEREPSKKPRVPLPRGQAEEFNMTWPSTPTGWPHPGDGPGTRECDVCQQCVTIPLRTFLELWNWNTSS